MLAWRNPEALAFLKIWLSSIKNEKIIDTYWQGISVSSCVSNNSAGVMILFNHDYECLEKSIGTGGRFAAVVLENSNVKVIVAICLLSE